MDDNRLIYIRWLMDSESEPEFDRKWEDMTSEERLKFQEDNNV